MWLNPIQPIRDASRMLIPSTITARRTRRYTSTLYIPGTIQRIGYYPMDDSGRSILQPPFVSNCPPTRPNISPPLTVNVTGVLRQLKTISKGADRL